MRRYAFVFFMMLVPVVAMAKQAVPMAADPELEARVMELSEELRCLVCQNQTIADSDAELAVDLRQQVREMLKEGKSEQDVIDFMVERYGDFVRYRPPFNTATFLLWLGPFLLLAVGLFVLVVNLRKRVKQVPESALSEEERANLKKLLGDK